MYTKLFKNIRLSPNDSNTSLKMRFQLKLDINHNSIYFYSIILISLLTTIFGIFTITNNNRDDLDLAQRAWEPLSLIHLSFIPLTVFLLNLVYRKQKNYVVLSAASNLTSKQSRVFLAKHHLPRNEKHTNLGMRTSRFIINHDPQNIIPDIFPEYLCLLREQQLEKLIIKLLNEDVLNLTSNSNQFIGTLNVESTISPCIKTLLLFSVIYMDGIPIMEKQFVTLTKLFPILDPFMANKLKSVKIEEEIGHIQWIFYLDYDWVDQIIDSSKSNGAYHIYLNNLNLNQHAKISSIS